MAEWKNACRLSFVKAEHYVVIADEQSHRAVWSRGGGHADQTRQEDHRWVCDLALLLLLGAGADGCIADTYRSRVLSHTEGKFSSTQHHESDRISARLCVSRHRRAVCPEANRRQRHRHLRHGGRPLQVQELQLAFIILSVSLFKKKNVTADGAPLCAELPARWVRASLQRSTRRCCVRPGATRSVLMEDSIKIIPWPLTALFQL